MAGLCLEQDQERRLGRGSKPDPDNDGNGETACPQGVRIFAQLLQESSSTTQRTAVYETRLYSGV
ncbi:hypothetical protein ACFSKU_08850 [Pontibacter silvestris]|uniref:Uncharacterized protein n=1 Tax=Pontibacter silvestris TaxID=2305183 RepID=A0ABW4WZ85_9BACT|nr:hypothetical protein [Pontibacter silvestris]MCC9138934.1 hypothetical protein [Pontibacter silvestris]